MNKNMNITAAQYKDDEGINPSIQATIDGQEMSVPMDPANRHYAALLEQGIAIQAAEVPVAVEAAPSLDNEVAALKARIVTLEGGV